MLLSSYYVCSCEIFFFHSGWLCFWLYLLLYKNERDKTVDVTNDSILYRKQIDSAFRLVFFCFWINSPLNQVANRFLTFTFLQTINKTYLFDLFLLCVYLYCLYECMSVFGVVFVLLAVYSFVVSPSIWR